MGEFACDGLTRERSSGGGNPGADRLVTVPVREVDGGFGAHASGLGAGSAGPVRAGQDGADCGGSESTRASRRGMKLATWNLQRLTRTTSVRMSRVRPHIDAVNADVWVLTETGEEVSPGPGYQGVATTEVDRASHYPGEVWTKIWSRWPIERLAPVSDPARCVAARVIPPHRAPFIVYGTVLPWPSSTWRGLASKGGVAFGAALEAQASDWASLQAAHPSDDLFVMGDLNQDLCVSKPCLLRLQAEPGPPAGSAGAGLAGGVHGWRERSYSARFTPYGLHRSHLRAGASECERAKYGAVARRARSPFEACRITLGWRWNWSGSGGMGLLRRAAFR
jgi:hypothetical protein